MIESEYYKAYRGPSLVKVILNEEDITEKIKEKYGENNNWSGFLWTYKELFGSECQGKHFRCDFKGRADGDDGDDGDDRDDREYWFHGYIHDINNYMNPPLAPTP